MHPIGLLLISELPNELVKFYIVFDPMEQRSIVSALAISRLAFHVLACAATTHGSIHPCIAEPRSDTDGSQGFSRWL
jgi:hypothetical protein